MNYQSENSHLDQVILPDEERKVDQNNPENVGSFRESSFAEAQDLTLTCLKQRLASSISYNVKQLSKEQQNNLEKQSSSQFLQDLTYKVDLSQLIEVLDTCYINKEMKYCPIVVKKAIYEQGEVGYISLLQVWDNQGTLTYERELKSQIQAWFVTVDTLVYKTYDPQAEFHTVYIVLLEKSNATYKTKIPLNVFSDGDHLSFGYCNKCLYIGVNQVIYIYEMEQFPIDNGETSIISAFYQNKCQPTVIDLGIKLHGFLVTKVDQAHKYLIVCCETNDNQVDFTNLYFYPEHQKEQLESKKKKKSYYHHNDNHQQKEKKNYQLCQLQEVIKKSKFSYDPIISLKHVVVKGLQYSVALRYSRNVDFYCNHSRISSTDELFEGFDQVDINFEAIYLKSKFSPNFKVINLDWKGRIRMDVAEDWKENEDNVFHKRFYQKIKNHVNIYQTFCMLNTTLIIANNKDLYIFDVIQEIWVQKYTCSHKIIRMFRNEKSSGEYNLSILLENGRFNLLDNEDTYSYSTDKWKLITNLKYQIAGIPKQIIFDKQYHRMLYAVSETKDNEYILQGFNRTKLYNLKSDLAPTSIVLPLFQQSKDSAYLIYTPSDANQEFGEIQIYRHYSSRNIHGVEELKLSLLREYCGIQDSCLSSLDPIQLVSGDAFHQAISHDIDKMILFISQRNIYKVNIETKEITRILGVNIRSIQLIDNMYGYAIVKDEICPQASGLKVFILSQIISDDIPIFYDIDPSLTGINNFIDFGEDNQRLAYLKTYDQINIIPPLHRTTINFMGMLPRDKYICCKKIGSQFMALDRNSTMSIWNCTTGKFVQKSQIQDDLSDFNIYSYEQCDTTYKREWYQPRTLIVSQTPANRVSEEQLYNDLESEITDALSYQYTQAKSYRTFKYIEIKDESSIIEHMTFIHPVFDERYQRIYISDDCRYMIQSVGNMRDQLYKWQNNQWILLKRIYNFPSDLSAISYKLFLFTPDLMRYLNFDLKNGRYIIFNTLTDKVINIPQALMDPKCGRQEDIVRRFNWVDNDKFLIASEWGQEKLVKINANNELEELSSNQIPGFNKSDWVNHLYVEPDSLELGDCYRRLRRKHQELKRMRYTFGNNHDESEINVMNSIDYNVSKATYEFVIDQSFSCFHWKLIECIRDCKLDIQNIDLSTLRTITLTILPNCESILHLLCRQSYALSTLLRRIPVQDKSIGYEMPFIQNNQNQSPLHSCLQRNDFQSIDLFLSYLKDAPIDHHGKVIVDLLPELIKNNVPSLLSYLDCRLLSTPQLEQIKRGSLINYDRLDIGLTTSRLWVDFKQVQKQILIDSQGSSNCTLNLKDSDVCLQFLDIPLLYSYDTTICEQFMAALANTDESEIFNLKSVRAMIDFLFPIAKAYTKWKLFYPFLLYLALYFVYNNWISNIGSNMTEYGVLISYSAVLIIFSIYFLVNELRQIMRSCLEYFASPWNYIDLIPPILIITNCVLEVSLPNYQYAWKNIFQSVSSLFMWLKLLYFFRMNNHTGHLIRMIVKVIYDMRTFLGVFVITTIAFADAFVSIQMVEGEDQNQLDKFFVSAFKTYNMILGNFELDEFKEEYRITATVLFVICTVFMMIIMLNLLIAIIGETFGEVQSNQINELYQERASIISENAYLVPMEVRRAMCPHDHYLIIGRQLDNQKSL